MELIALRAFYSFYQPMESMPELVKLLTPVKIGENSSSLDKAQNPVMEEQLIIIV